MFGLFQRPKLEATFAPSEAISNEFSKEISLSGRLSLSNQGSDADLTAVEMMIVAGFRRIPLDVPAGWRAFQLAKGEMKADNLAWTLTLDSPLRAQAGELFIGAHDQKRQSWQWRLPFQFELR